jgi:uncharacterized protein YbbK (DUF523 family)
VRSRYDGTAREDPCLSARLAGGCPVPVCPEQLGGLSTPRAPSAIEGGAGADVLDGLCRVADSDGVDRTAEFVRGAREAAAIARRLGATRAILKAASPSCDATIGVAAESLRREGIEIESVG